MPRFGGCWFYSLSMLWSHSTINAGMGIPLLCGFYLWLVLLNTSASSTALLWVPLSPQVEGTRLEGWALCLFTHNHSNSNRNNQRICSWGAVTCRYGTAFYDVLLLLLDMGQRSSCLAFSPHLLPHGPTGWRLLLASAPTTGRNLEFWVWIEPRRGSILMP